MKNKILNRFSISLITLIIASQFILAPSVLAQSIESINGEIGSGGNTSTVDEGSNTGTTMLVIAGVAVAALLIYKLVFYKDAESTIDENSDSTQTDSQSSLQKKLIRSEEKNYSDSKRLNEELPINLILNFNRYKFSRSESYMSVGLSYRF